MNNNEEHTIYLAMRGETSEAEYSSKVSIKVLIGKTTEQAWKLEFSGVGFVCVQKGTAIPLSKQKRR